MNTKLLAGIAIPAMMMSGSAMAFGWLGFIGSVAGLAVGNAGGAMLSAGGVGPAGRQGATVFAPASAAIAPNGPVAGRPVTWAAYSSGDWARLRPTRPGGSSQSVQVSSLGRVYGSPEALHGLPRPLQGRAGIDRSGVQLCRDALARTAAGYGAVWVEAASAGPALLRSNATLAPLEVRILYAVPSGYEVKQSKVTCRMRSAAGGPR